MAKEKILKILREQEESRGVNPEKESKKEPLPKYDCLTRKLKIKERSENASKEK